MSWLFSESEVGSIWF